MPKPMRLPPPSTAAITRMEDAITWNRFLKARRLSSDVGARRRHAVEGHLLSFRHQPADRAPPIRLRTQRHCLAAERPVGAQRRGRRFVIARAG